MTKPNIDKSKEQPKKMKGTSDSGSSIDVGTSIQEAHILLEYAASQGRELDEDTASTIVQSKRIFDTSEWTAEAETKFWVVFNKLAKSVQV